MELLQGISEDEMIAVFLRAEIESARFGGPLERILARDGRDVAILRHPNPADAGENAYRRNVLDEHRAYERREGLFAGFPHDVAWHRALLTPDEVLDMLFIDWDWWLEISGGTRRPRDAAERIRAGLVPGADVAGDELVAAALRGSPTPPELIALTTRELRPIVLVEGHVRLTAYALFPEYLPDRLEIVLGLSAHADAWSEF